MTEKVRDSVLHMPTMSFPVLLPPNLALSRLALQSVFAVCDSLTSQTSEERAPLGRDFTSWSRYLASSGLIQIRRSTPCGYASVLLGPVFSLFSDPPLGRVNFSDILHEYGTLFPPPGDTFPSLYFARFASVFPAFLVMVVANCLSQGYVGVPLPPLLCLRFSPPLLCPDFA